MDFFFAFLQLIIKVKFTHDTIAQEANINILFVCIHIWNITYCTYIYIHMYLKKFRVAAQTIHTY